ncbi:MAG: CBS domain-containing protein [Propionibacteriales bacterium]|nr:CBS domain-containing protein [Propionibacteriales bacterium]
MLVHEVMTADVVSVGPDTPLKTAVQLLNHHQITTLPVIDERGELLGVVSEADVLVDAFLPDPRAHGKPVDLTGGPAFATVGQVMSRQVLTIAATADVAQAADLMLGTVVKSLPVLALLHSGVGDGDVDRGHVRVQG